MEIKGQITQAIAARLASDISVSWDAARRAVMRGDDGAARVELDRIDAIKAARRTYDK